MKLATKFDATAEQHWQSTHKPSTDSAVIVGNPAISHFEVHFDYGWGDYTRWRSHEEALAEAEHLVACGMASAIDNRVVMAVAA
ncbi:hypothetical protein HNR26_000002 [Rhizobium rosettiformans]|uniref:Uncharacterized protein n=2 Tax=Rhizobium rosettiformans TaxID=1368430 RepID=A0A4S8Q6Q0_9HYPH|nr:hypothetical protein [Rhizobium rosettiformans]MBB5273964.1 hypothetical protein [Rhizobium rosettiformans]THV38362.1 hypothetical protein FAA86_06130 [Rhizobium rosettiformans W3]